MSSCVVSRQAGDMVRSGRYTHDVDEFVWCYSSRAPDDFFRSLAMGRLSYGEKRPIYP